MEEMEIVRRLYHVVNRMRKQGLQRVQEKKTPHPVAAREIMILDAIEQNQKPMKMNDISTHFNITPAAVSQVENGVNSNDLSDTRSKAGKLFMAVKIRLSTFYHLHDNIYK